MKWRRQQDKGNRYSPPFRREPAATAPPDVVIWSLALS